MIKHRREEKDERNEEKGKRKSRILTTPADKLVVIDKQQEQNDDDAERAALVAEDKEIVTQFSTPRISNRNSITSTVSSIDSPQKEHIQGCLKLFAENKINKDNAWNLQLIDFMSSMLRKHDARMENLQIASTTLDASARIYSFRVDAIHHDVLKMAGGLSKATQSRRGKKGEEDENNEGDNGDNAEDNQQRKKEKRKKVAKSSLSGNPQSQLNGDIEINECIDPFFAQLAATTGDMTSSNRAFNATLPIEDKTLALILRSDTLFLKPLEEHAKLVQENLEYFQIKKGLFPSVKEDGNICTPFHGFSILDWDPEDEEIHLKNTKKWLENNLNLSQQAMAFDMNADVEPLPQNDVNGFEYDDDHHADVESDDEERGVVPNAFKRDKQKTVAHLVDMRPLSHGDGFLEYSYSTAVIGAWAGPSHWKLKNNVNKGSRHTEKHNDFATVNVKKVISRKKKELDFLTEGMEFNAMVNQCPEYKLAPNKTIIGRKTLSHGAAWSKNFETPVDRGFNLIHLRKIHCKESSIVRPISEVMAEEQKENDAIHRISDINNYDYDNDNDNSYCPNSQPMDDDVGWQNDDGEVGGDVHNQNGLTDGNDMVEPPAKVAKIFIPYAMRAKKVDMKQLKQVTWKILIAGEDNKENEDDNGADPSSEQKQEDIKETSFKTLYKNLPLKLSNNMKECLSVPLSLLAVLHLANEKGMHLKCNETMTDFIIFKTSTTEQ